MRPHGPLTLGERLEVEAALDAAFAPLRERRTDLSPLRVRAAVRWGRGVEPSAPLALRAPAALRWSGTLARLSELSVAVGMSVMIFGAALGPALEATRGPEPAPGPATAQVAGMSVEEQAEIRATRTEWHDALRARLSALRDRYIPLQDWLDPNVVRPLPRRIDVPAPRSDVAGRAGIY